MVEVTILPNHRRPGIGRKPAAVAQRPWLPQHARLCPVLEAGSALGVLVHAPLEDAESYQVRYLPDHSFRLSFFVADGLGSPDIVFTVRTVPSAGGGVLMADELTYLNKEYGIDEQSVRRLKDALIVNLDTPPGGVGLRGAVDFRTPDGWDTVYTGVLNHAAPPQAPALSVRVQTDWYAHNTEFRYLLQPGAMISASGAAPVGQVFFVPREEVRLREASERDIAAFRADQQQYWQEKAADQVSAPYGIRYSPHYRKQSRGFS